MIQASASSTVRHGLDASNVIVRDMGAALTAAQLLTALTATPIAQGTNVFIATISDAGGVISLPIMPVGAEIVLQLTGGAGDTFLLQENALPMGPRTLGVTTGATLFDAFAWDTTAAATATLLSAGGPPITTTTLTFGAGSTVQLHLRKIRANTAGLAVADGWMLVSFTSQ